MWCYVRYPSGRLPFRVNQQAGIVLSAIRLVTVVNRISQTFLRHYSGCVAPRTCGPEQRWWHPFKTTYHRQAGVDAVEAVLVLSKQSGTVTVEPVIVSSIQLSPLNTRMIRVRGAVDAAAQQQAIQKFQLSVRSFSDARPPVQLQP